MAGVKDELAERNFQKNCRATNYIRKKLDLDPGQSLKIIQIGDDEQNLQTFDNMKALMTSKNHTKDLVLKLKIVSGMSGGGANYSKLKNSSMNNQ